MEFHSSPVCLKSPLSWSSRNRNPTLSLRTAETLPLSLSLARSLSHLHANKNTHTHKQRPLPRVPYALLCPVPFAKEGGGIHRGLIHLGSADPPWWQMLLEACRAVCVCVCVCVCWVGGRTQKKKVPHFPAGTQPRRPATRDPRHAETPTLCQMFCCCCCCFWQRELKR